MEIGSAPSRMAATNSLPATATATSWRTLIRGPARRGIEAGIACAKATPWPASSLRRQVNRAISPCDSFGTGIVLPFNRRDVVFGGDGIARWREASNKRRTAAKALLARFSKLASVSGLIGATGIIACLATGLGFLGGILFYGTCWIVLVGDSLSSARTEPPACVRTASLSTPRPNV